MRSESLVRAYDRMELNRSLNGVDVAVIRFSVSLAIIKVVNFIFWPEDVSKQRIEGNNFSISFTLFRPLLFTPLSRCRAHTTCRLARAWLPAYM